ncbi:MAG: HAMP domain-containing protein, partial [Alphaproteobacteria bacterium]
MVISGGGERLRALLWVEKASQYLLVGRAIDPGVSQYVEGVTRAVDSYKEAITKRGVIEAKVSILYILFALGFVLASVWAGLMFASALAEPISNLIQTADRVRAGDLAARAPVRERGDEIGNLLIGFNRMTAQLERQRDALIAANAEMDDRRRFTAAVLAGVSSGVLGLDEAGVIRAANRYAEVALGAPAGGLVDTPLAEASPELAEALAESAAAETEVRLVRNGRQRVLLARSAAGQDLDLDAHVVTFTDITDLLAAKRQAAWSGVARRVAHEIKNPLTPIQLAAERLKRRYLKSVADDSEIFTLCCDTIIRQVAALRGMVDEFSDFARLPTPSMQAADLAALCQEVLFLLELQHKGVAFELENLAGDAFADCDPGQITRALNNVLINAVHAVEARAGREEAGWRGRVHVGVERQDDQIVVRVEDDGDGFPEELLENVVEPY